MLIRSAQKWLAAGLLYLLCCFSCVVQADILSASIDYHSGEYQKAYDAFEQLAKLGNKDAIYNIAVMYLHGQGREQDLNKAYAWFTLAADFGLGDASHAAKLIESKSDNPQGLINAYQQLQQQLSLRHFEQTLAPKFLPIDNQSDSSPIANKQPKLRFEAEAKYPAAALNQGLEGWVWLEFDIDAGGAVTDIDVIEYYPDKSFNRSVLNAVKRWRYEVNDKGKTDVERKSLPLASRTLVKHFTTYKGKRYQASFSRQRQQYQRQVNDLIERAEQGNAAVQYHIANFMMGHEHNATRLLRYHWSADIAGSELLLEAATNGYANAQYRLGSYLLEGIDSQQDKQKGINWITKAAIQGFKPAQYRLGLQLLDEQPDEALAWLIKAAKQGHFRAMRDLVDSYVQQQLWQQAQEWLDKALSVDDEHPSLWVAKSKIYVARGDNKLGDEARQKAVEYAEDRGWQTQ